MAEGKTIITNAAKEPEIVDLQNFLNKMGAKIKGAGANTIEIEGVKTLKDVSYNIMPDRIETGTFLCIAAATNGNMILKDVDTEHITPIIHKLEETGCKLNIEKGKIEIQAPKKLKAIDIEGVKTLKDVSYNIMPDRIETGTFLCIAAATNGNMILKDVDTEHITPNGCKNKHRRKNSNNKRSKKAIWYKC